MLRLLKAPCRDFSAENDAIGYLRNGEKDANYALVRCTLVVEKLPLNRRQRHENS